MTDMRDKSNIENEKIEYVPIYQKQLGELLKFAKGNLSMAEFAAKCGVSPTTFSRIVNGTIAKPLEEELIAVIAENSDETTGISYEDLMKANGMVPKSDDIVFKTKGGNKLAKAGTVSYRGKNNESLSKYGSEFTLEVHPSVEGLFILKGNKNPEVETEEVKAEEIAVPEVEDEESLLDDLTADVDATEINADDFDYTL